MYDLELEKLAELKVYLSYKMIDYKEYLSFFTCTFFTRDRRYNTRSIK